MSNIANATLCFVVATVVSALGFSPIGAVIGAYAAHQLNKHFS